MNTTGTTITWQRERLLETLDAYNRGPVDATLLRKQTEAQASDAGMAQGADPDIDTVGRMTFAISTEEVDRHGDVRAVEGWRLESYREIPCSCGHTITPVPSSDARPASGRGRGHCWRKWTGHLPNSRRR